MVVESHAGVELDRCCSCGGLWFDRGELARVLKRVRYRTGFRADRTARQPLTVVSSPQCPKCNASSLGPGQMWSLNAIRCRKCDGFLFPAASLQDLAERPLRPEPSTIHDTIVWGPFYALIARVARMVTRGLPG